MESACDGEMDHSKDPSKSKAIAFTARRKRLEIMRFRMMTNSTFVVESPCKRLRPKQMKCQDIHDLAGAAFLLKNECPSPEEKRRRDESISLEGAEKADPRSKEFLGTGCYSEDIQSTDSSGEEYGLKISVDCNTSMIPSRKHPFDTQIDEQDTSYIQSDATKMAGALWGSSDELQQEISSKGTSYCVYCSTYGLGAALGDGCPPHGIVSVCGRRREMEDAVSVIPSFLSLPSWALGACSCNNINGSAERSACHFFGIYDGHGGIEAALHCKTHLHEALIEEIRNIVDACKEETKDMIGWESKWQEAFAACFLRMDTEISNINKEPMVPETVGSTAAVVILAPFQIIVANCGDSRVVLSRSGQAIPLSSDHKPQRPDELARVEAAGGRVLFRNGYRVLGILAMSRAIGDRYLKPYVIADPEVTCTQRTNDDECLIIASDGLWDILSNDLVCEVARTCLAGWRSCNRSSPGSPDLDNSLTESPAATAAAILTKLALAKGSSDNISVVVVDLTPRMVNKAT